MSEKSREEYEFKKLVKFLKKQKGQGTELISVYIPPGSNVNEVTARLRDEYGQAMNIKSKQTRKNVQAAIDKIIGVLKGVHKPPEKGAAIFCGNINGKIELYIVNNPPEDIPISLYRCDSTFYIEPLEDMLEKKDTYGLFVLDRREATFAFLKGKKIIIVKKLTSTVPGKHHKGGQSARRFERLIEGAVHDFYKEIGETANSLFSDPKVKAIIVGGPGPTKHDFLKGDYLFNNVKEKIAGIIDTSYTDEFGIRELANKAGEVIKELEINKEKELVDKFVKEAVTGGLATYGEKEVKEALLEGKVETLLLSESLDDEKIEELSELAEQMGSKVEMISEDTVEGEQFKVAFGGIGALLRFK